MVWITVFGKDPLAVLDRVIIAFLIFCAGFAPVAENITADSGMDMPGEALVFTHFICHTAGSIKGTECEALVIQIGLLSFPPYF